MFFFKVWIKLYSKTNSFKGRWGGREEQQRVGTQKHFEDLGFFGVNVSKTFEWHSPTNNFYLHYS